MTPGVRLGRRHTVVIIEQEKNKKVENVFFKLVFLSRTIYTGSDYISDLD